MTSKGPGVLPPLNIETLSPQLHGFIRAYVRQLERRTEPEIGDEPDKKTALTVARTIVRLVHDRYESSKLVSELGDYLRDGTHRASLGLKRLLDELRQGPEPAEALSNPTVAPTPAPAPAAAPEPPPAALPEPPKPSEPAPVPAAPVPPAPPASDSVEDSMHQSMHTSDTPHDAPAAPGMPHAEEGLSADDAGPMRGSAIEDGDPEEQAQS